MHVDPPNWTFSEDYILALVGAVPSNLYMPFPTTPELYIQLDLGCWAYF